MGFAFPAAPPKPLVTIIESCRVAPARDAAEISFPLTSFDMIFVKYRPKYRLIFYRFPSCSESHFLQLIVPSLKESLSQTLKHFLPISGNIIFPDNRNPEAVPEIQFQPGDSISVTIAESFTTDFDSLIGNQPRNSNEFYAFVPLDMTSSQPARKVARPLFALQITLFPDAGISIGFTYHHVLGDGSSFERFMRAWSSINAKVLDNEEQVLAANDLLPFYDRSVVKDPFGSVTQRWKEIKDYVMKVNEEQTLDDHSYSDNKVRATYVMHKKDIERLRNLVVAERPNLVTTHLSSFVIVSSFILSCLVKSGEVVDDAEPEYFDIPVNARARMDPPLPAGYFGNCLAFVLAQSTHGELRGDAGFLNAVEAIAVLIGRKLNTKGELFRDASEWSAKYKSVIGKRFFSVVGSPKSDFYDSDFGWGKPRKSEVLITDGGGAMSLSRATESEGGLEIGLSLPNKNMAAFAAIFSSLLPKD